MIENLKKIFFGVKVVSCKHIQGSIAQSKCQVNWRSTDNYVEECG